MGAPVLLSPAEWEAIKIASIRGVSDDELAAQYDIQTAAIRKRRSRDAVWSGVAAKGAFGNPVTRVSQESQNTQIAEKAGQSVALSLAERGEQCRSRLLDLALKGVEKAHQADLQVTDWQHVKTITEIAAKAGNWQSEQASASIQVLFTGAESVPTFDAEAEVVGCEPEGLIEV